MGNFLNKGELKHRIKIFLTKYYSNITGKNIAGSYGRVNIYLRAVILVVFIAAGTGLFVYGHGENKMQEKLLQEQLNQKIVNIKKANAFMEEHPQHDSYIRQLAVKSTSLTKIIPEGQDGDESLLSEIQAMADTAGVSLRGVVPGEAVNAGECGYVPITLEVSCNYFTLMNFLERLEAVEEIKPRRLMSVKNSSLTCKDGRLMGKLTIQAYFQKNA